jgi:hypothetical protein
MRRVRLAGRLLLLLLAAVPWAAASPPRSPDGGAVVFADVPPTYWAHAAIETVYAAGVTAGCATDPLRYCPEAAVTRAELAGFLLKAVEDPGFTPPACVAPAFVDVPCSQPFAPWINELVRRGVVAGCGGGAYCPAAPVTREQMAVFLVKIIAPRLVPAPCTAPPFADVGCTSPFAPWIAELVRGGITAGCDATRYCPGSAVTRAEMAGFLVRRFGLGDAFTLVGIHPGAAAQPTETGRMLVTLVPWQGRLYAGYGDWNANTGPIAVTAWDPTGLGFRDYLVSCTEAIYTYRVLGDRLWAPAIDPAGAPRCDPPADFAVGEPWTDRLTLRGPLHVFDAATTGSDVWLVGADSLGATAWRSVDGGAHWTVAERVPQTGVARFYFAGMFAGKLYVEAVDSSGVRTPRVFDPVTDTWAPGPDLLQAAGEWGWHPVVFAGHMVYQTHPPTRDAGARLLAFDGASVTQPLSAQIYDFIASGPELFALGTDGVVWRTIDLVTWQAIAQGPPGGRSIGAVGGRLYVGTGAAALYRLRSPGP